LPEDFDFEEDEDESVRFDRGRDGGIDDDMYLVP